MAALPAVERRMTPQTSEPVALVREPSSLLDSAAWASLTGPHAHFAEGRGLARRYRADLSPFAAISSPRDEQAWADLHRLYGPDQAVVLSGVPGFTGSVPAGWSVEVLIPGVQLVATSAHHSEPDDEALVIGPKEAAEAADLVARTEPGPFRPNTYRLGTLLGGARSVRCAPILTTVAAASPPAWSEPWATSSVSAERLRSCTPARRTPGPSSSTSLSASSSGGRWSSRRSGRPSRTCDHGGAPARTLQVIVLTTFGGDEQVAAPSRRVGDDTSHGAGNRRRRPANAR
jgi:hypothetical protein